MVGGEERDEGRQREISILQCELSSNSVIGITMTTNRCLHDNRERISGVHMIKKESFDLKEIVKYPVLAYRIEGTFHVSQKHLLLFIIKILTRSVLNNINNQTL